MANGNIIFLNGTSSSGKTTIAKALQDILVEPYLLVALDNFTSMLPERYRSPECEEVEAVPSIIANVISGMHHCIATLAASGNNVIVDHVLQERAWLNDCIRLFDGLPVLFVGVRCPLEVLEQRERERGDRAAGTARYQFDTIHANGIYDVEVDTSALSPLECAAMIRNVLLRNGSLRAFTQLRDALKTDCV